MSPALLWVAVAFTVLSASAIFYLTVGPLKTAANVGTLRAFAFVQFAAAAVLAGARLLGKA